MCEDFVMLYGYTADQDNYISRTNLLEGIKRHIDLLLRDFMIRDQNGQLLAGRLANIETPAIPQRGILVDDLMQTKIVYQFAYPAAKPPPLSHLPGADRQQQRRICPVGPAAYRPPGRQRAPANGRLDWRG